MLGLLVVVYKIPYSSCSYVNQVRCNWCVPMLLLSSCGIVYSRVQKTPASEKKEDVRISHQTENQKENVGIRTWYVYTWYPLLFYE